MPTPSPAGRRQWLVSRGLLSPNPGPSRRLGSLLPRPPPSPNDVSLRVANRATPVVVARHSTDTARSPRAVSMPSSELTDLAHPRRIASTRADRPVEPPSRRRFLFRTRRKDRGGLGRVHAGGAAGKGPGGGRAVYTVVDRELPRHVLRGDRTYEEGEWREYRERVDRLAEDERFMEYLTAPVQAKSVLGGRKEEVEEVGATQMAVNKLYPLAFIRLLEAHAKYSSDVEACDPADEAHRYDDVDREEEEARLCRNASSRMYDMGRFRTVAGSGAGSKDAESMRRGGDGLVELRKKRGEGREPAAAVFVTRFGRQNRVASVPVC